MSADSLLSRSESALCYGDDLTVWSVLPGVLSGLGEVRSEGSSLSQLGTFLTDAQKKTKQDMFIS